MSSGMKSRSEERKRRYLANFETMNATRRARYKEVSEHRAAAKRERRAEISGGCSDVCEMLEHQHEINKEDPDALTTEFKQMILGRDCPTD